MRMKLNKNEYTVEAATGGGFFAYYRDNLLCSAYGETPDEAYENLERDSINSHRCRTRVMQVRYVLLTIFLVYVV